MDDLLPMQMSESREELKSEGNSLVCGNGLVTPGQPLLQVARAEEVVDHDGAASIGGGGQEGE